MRKRFTEFKLKSKQNKRKILTLYLIMIGLPGMLGVLDNFLAILPPFVAIIQNINIAHSLEAKPGLPHFPPCFHVYLLHLHRRNHPQMLISAIVVAVRQHCTATPLPCVAHALIHFCPCPNHNFNNSKLIS